MSCAFRITLPSNEAQLLAFRSEIARSSRFPLASCCVFLHVSSEGAQSAPVALNASKLHMHLSQLQKKLTTLVELLLQSWAYPLSCASHRPVGSSGMRGACTGHKLNEEKKETFGGVERSPQAHTCLWRKKRPYQLLLFQGSPEDEAIALAASSHENQKNSLPKLKSMDLRT